MTTPVSRLAMIEAASRKVDLCTTVVVAFCMAAGLGLAAKPAGWPWTGRALRLRPADPAGAAPVLMPVLMMLMYLTPILYPLSLVPERLQRWVSANPFTWLVDRLRAALLEGRLAPEAGDLAALAVALALFAAGRWMFRRLSPHFEDFV